MKSIITRFLSYQLGCPGSSFSYFAGGHFTVIEGRLTDESRRQLEHEMMEPLRGVEQADLLQTSASWDADHCNRHELLDLLNLIQPLKIECPGYDPYTDHGEGCLEIIADYRDRRRNTNGIPKITHITEIKGLEQAEEKAFRNTLYNPLHISDNANDNSTVKHFRKGSFNVLSLGDVESPMIGARLRRQRILRSETDVMILAHRRRRQRLHHQKILKPHRTRRSDLLRRLRQQVRPSTRRDWELLHEQGIRLMTTKTGGRDASVPPATTPVRTRPST